ncbi:hypothetical protein BD560DRAFT_443585 [Blakeslea trispora]|nr:hypothetical protein BD560DRAFT_443585 [Blakeslea trispora]
MPFGNKNRHLETLGVVDISGRCKLGPPSDKCSPVVFSAQDLVLTVSSATFLNSDDYTVFYGFLLRPVTAGFMRVPEFKRKLKNLMCKMAKELINPETLKPRIELLEYVIWAQGLPRLGSPARRSNHNTEDPKTTFLNAIYGTI